MQRALVCGAGGFIGHHLVRFLKNQGYWVRGADQKHPDFSSSAADEFLLLDLRRPDDCRRALMLEGQTIAVDEVYQLAADMGGMGFISSAECEILHNNTLINTNMIEAARKGGAKRYFFSSSVCVYRDMEPGESALSEAQAYPAAPDNEYGWEKLFAERVAAAFGRNCGLQVRIARFQNCYGPEGCWRGGREKAPAAICRKVAQAVDGGTIDIWGDGLAVRSFIYVSDLIEGVYSLMHSTITDPVNIGNNEYVTVGELTEKIIAVSGKSLTIRYIDGPVGVRSRNFSNQRISSLGWKARIPLDEGLALLYPWISAQLQQDQSLGGQAGSK